MIGANDRWEYNNFANIQTRYNTILFHIFTLLSFERVEKKICIENISSTNEIAK